MFVFNLYRKTNSDLSYCSSRVRGNPAESRDPARSHSEGPAGLQGSALLWYRKRPPGGVNKQRNTSSIPQTQTRLRGRTPTHGGGSEWGTAERLTGGLPGEAAQVRSDLFPPTVFFLFLFFSACNSHLRGPRMPPSLRNPGILTSLKPARAATGRGNANWLEVFGKVETLFNLF